MSCIMTSRSRGWPARILSVARRFLLIALLVGALVLPQPLAAGAAAPVQEAVFAGGCFWCLEHDLEHLPGVLEAVSGYSGGRLANPSYRQVSAGGTGHQEAVRVRFDPARLSYSTLLRAYWRNVDPLDGGGQFCDPWGRQYRSSVFYSSEAQRDVTARYIAHLHEAGVFSAPIATTLEPLDAFYPAEAYHQNYAEHNTLKYRYYRWACGRDQRLDAVWGTRARSRDTWAGSR